MIQNLSLIRAANHKSFSTFTWFIHNWIYTTAQHLLNSTILYIMTVSSQVSIFFSLSSETVRAFSLPEWTKRTFRILSFYKGWIFNVKLMPTKKHQYVAYMWDYSTLKHYLTWKVIHSMCITWAIETMFIQLFLNGVTSWAFLTFGFTIVNI